MDTVVAIYNRAGQIQVFGPTHQGDEPSWLQNEFLRGGEPLTGLNPWSSLKTRDRVIYADPPLAQVICQINFPEKISILGQDPTTVGQFQDKIDSVYPLTRTSFNAILEFTVPEGGLPIPNGAPRGISIRNFVDTDENWSVTLAPDSIALSCRIYPGFEQFHARLDVIIAACIDTIHPTLIRRVGLRFINEIRGGSQLNVNPELRGMAANEILGPLVERNLQSISLRHEGVKVNYVHGAFEDGSTVEQVAGTIGPTGPFYLIDIDVFQEFARGQQPKFEAQTVVDIAESFHAIESQLFRWSITDEFHNQLSLPEAK